jgi:23S rRNA-/tRNA-specific pseudouridylate synthase
VRTLERHGRWALVEVEASRAYRHQVRVQLAAAGWPIAGDREYGGSVADALDGRHALHASHLGWDGDASVPAFVADSPLPSDLRAFLQRG